MASRVPVQHFGMRSANSYIASSPLHDLNTVDSRPADLESISDVDRDAVTEDSLENDDDSNAVVSVFPFYFLTDSILFCYRFVFVWLLGKFPRKKIDCAIKILIELLRINIQKNSRNNYTMY